MRSARPPCRVRAPTGAATEPTERGQAALRGCPNPTLERVGAPLWPGASTASRTSCNIAGTKAAGEEPPLPAATRETTETGADASSARPDARARARNAAPQPRGDRGAHDRKDEQDAGSNGAPTRLFIAPWLGYRQTRAVWALNRSWVVKYAYHDESYNLPEQDSKRLLPDFPPEIMDALRAEKCMVVERANYALDRLAGDLERPALLRRLCACPTSLGTWKRHLLQGSNVRPTTP